jgi:hypothetical protein
MKNIWSLSELELLSQSNALVQLFELQAEIAIFCIKE